MERHAFKSIDFIIRNSKYLRESEYHASWRRDCSIEKAKEILEKAKFVKNTKEMNATLWSVRCALDRFHMRSKFLDKFKHNNRQSVYKLLTHDYVIGLFLDCAIALRAGHTEWVRSLTLMKGMLVSVTDPKLAGELSKSSTARAIISKKVEKLKENDVHSYLISRLTSQVANYSWAAPVVRGVHRNNVSESEKRLAARFL